MLPAQTIDYSIQECQLFLVRGRFFFLNAFGPSLHVVPLHLDVCRLRKGLALLTPLWCFASRMVRVVLLGSLHVDVPTAVHFLVQEVPVLVFPESPPQSVWRAESVPRPAI